MEVYQLEFDKDYGLSFQYPEDEKLSTLLESVKDLLETNVVIDIYNPELSIPFSSDLFQLAQNLEEENPEIVKLILKEMNKNIDLQLRGGNFYLVPAKYIELVLHFTMRNAKLIPIFLTTYQLSLYPFKIFYSPRRFFNGWMNVDSKIIRQTYLMVYFWMNEKTFKIFYKNLERWNEGLIVARTDITDHLILSHPERFFNACFYSFLGYPFRDIRVFLLEIYSKSKFSKK